MNPQDQKQFQALYQKQLQALTLQGLRKKTIASYSRAVRRISQHFDRCPINLTQDDLKEYFANLVKTRSWSIVKIDRCGLQFFWKHILEKEWDWVKIVKPPVFRRLPDVLTVKETELLLNTVRKLCYKVFLFTVYSMGLRLGEGLKLEVGDIDSQKMRVHIREAKGGKDRFVPLPETTLKVLRLYWLKHRNSKLLFPTIQGTAETIKNSTKHMHEGGAQEAMQAALQECKIQKRVTVHSLRHSFATHLVEAGVQLRLIQEHLGHVSPETTAVYTKLTEVSYQNGNSAINSIMRQIRINWDEVA
ncbi:MAG: site-specific integrase [Candidatus Riflebacteria bacterium]|nr:site-specific integrase [Candidatus Riflebacteria bacterium]